MFMTDVRFSQADYEQYYLPGCYAIQSGSSLLTLMECIVPIFGVEEKAVEVSSKHRPCHS
jgi:hypothetical protein